MSTVIKRPTYLMATRPLDVDECRQLVESKRWLSKVVNAAEGGCVNWTAAQGNGGYGKLYMPGGFLARAHRVAWVAANGMDVPPGLVIDHLCGNPKCVNPQHLDAVTQRTNMLRAPGLFSSENAQKDTCPAGHPLSGPDADLRKGQARKGYRACRTCGIGRGRMLLAAARALGLTFRQYVTKYGYRTEVARAVVEGGRR